VPVFLGQGGHTKYDLPKLVAQARERHRGVEISLESPIGEQPSVIEAIAAALVRPGGRSSP
jgi:sirohydrochlorin cobaltochelatase